MHVGPPLETQAVRTTVPWKNYVAGKTSLFQLSGLFASGPPNRVRWASGGAGLVSGVTQGGWVGAETKGRGEHFARKTPRNGRR